MYSLVEVLPFIYCNAEEDPSVNFDAFDEEIHEELDDALYSLFKSEYGSNLDLSLPEFTATSDDGQTKTFPAKVFHFSRTDAKKELKDSYEGKTFYNYEFEITDLDSTEIYSVSTSFYNSEVNGINVTLAQSKVAKTNLFVIRSGVIVGVYTDFAKASAKADVADVIAEVPENSDISFKNGRILESLTTRNKTGKAI